MFLKGVKFVKIYMVKLKIYMVKISMKVTYLNYLDFTQQTISVTTVMSKYHFLKILGKKEVLLT